MANLFFLRKYQCSQLIRSGFIFFVLLCNFSCTQTSNSDAQSQASDPFEPVNRLMWDFNYQIMDNYIYRPVTQTYVDWVPTPGRKAINNFVLNFEEPSTLLNNLIQLNFKYSAQAFFRFSVNSTFGLVGFIDVAEKLGVPRRRETFSNVLGHWSVPNGPYLMIPFIGPRTTRKLVGGIVDCLYFPFSYLTTEEEVALKVLDALDVRESLLGQEVLLEQSLDPYLFVRDAYIQNEAFKVSGKSADTKQSMQEDTQTEDEFDLDLDEFMDEIE
jgi:phospholipid-binding lipoprotein MlaA